MESKYLVFFDVDGTIINLKSMFSFLRFYWVSESKLGFLLGNLKYSFYTLETFYLYKRYQSRELINSRYYKNFSGVEMSQLLLKGKEWWSKVSTTQNLLNQEVIKELRLHQEKGAEIIFVSGSMPACIMPLARELGVRFAILTELEESYGICTGKIKGQTNIGKGKQTRIAEFLKEHPNIDPSRCYAYGDHISDFPMLEMVGNPVVVGNDKFLLKQACEKKWKIISSEALA